MFKSKNINYAFNNEYLNKLCDIRLNEEKKDKKENKDNKEITAVTFNEELLELINGNKDFIYSCGNCFFDNLIGKAEIKYYEIQYPGLLAGIGNTHEIPKSENKEKNKKLDGQIQLGFSFDYVTGVPYVPGSTIKGVIHSVFFWAAMSDEDIDKLCKEKGKVDEKKAALYKSMAKEYRDYLNPICNALPKDDCTVYKQFIDKYLSNNDIFWNAYLVKPDKKNLNVMGTDNITKHESEIKDPQPITLIKIMSGNKIGIGISAKDTTNDTTNDSEEISISAVNRKTIYYRILEDFGIGAKTNEGYGALVEMKNNKS